MQAQPAAEVERFEAEFVSLFALARQQGRHHMADQKRARGRRREAGARSREDRGDVLPEGGLNRKIESQLDTDSSS
jgi:hypothetical protein